MANDDITNLTVSTLKGLAIDAVEKAQSGHPGTPMGLADITVQIFDRYLRHDPKQPNWLGRDRFVLSAGHASMLLYGILHLTGYDLPLSELENFRQWGSKTPGHPEHGHTVGVETTTGPLGQGVGNAVGFALGLAMKAARFGMPFEESRVFCICSDGDLMEGVSGEASSLAGHLGLGNLVMIYDDNRITIEGETSLAFTEDVGKRYEAYGWGVQRIDGHDRAAIAKALETAVADKTKPQFIVARTHIAHGAPKAQDTAESHGAPLGKDEIAAIKKGMSFDSDKHFAVPDAVKAHFAARLEEHAAVREAWEQRYATWRKENAAKAKELDALEAVTIPSDLYAQLQAALPEKEDATRGLSGALEQKVAELVPSLVGGSADLAPSTKTLIKKAGSIGRGEFGGRNMHFGIREHAMGAILNGLSLSGGFVPFGATFLVFSDYMRPSVRLSALMERQAIWIYTHDSIFLGEDGPTHQPVEHVWALRLIPNLAVVRPADALETAAAWAIALGRTKAPTAFVLSRQKVANIKRPEGFDPNDVLKGGYIAVEASGGTPDVVILATGSEVGLAIAARTELEAKGTKTRVVSVPCLEVFAAQDAAYREKVLPNAVKKVAIEAGRSDPWKGWVGLDGLAIGLDHYGASAPDKVLAEKFGFTPKSVVEKISAWLGANA